MFSGYVLLLKVVPCPLPSCFKHSEFFFWKIAYLYFSHLAVFLRFFLVPLFEKKVLFSFCLTFWGCGFCSGAFGIVVLAPSVCPLLEWSSVSSSVMYDSETPWTVAHQGPLSMEFSRQESWSGLLLPSAEDFPNPGI